MAVVPPILRVAVNRPLPLASPKLSCFSTIPRRTQIIFAFAIYPQRHTHPAIRSGKQEEGKHLGVGVGVSEKRHSYRRH